MIFKFRALSDENDGFIRDYEIEYDDTLLELHDIICRDLGFDASAMACFYLSDSLWERHTEFTLFDMGGGEDGPVPMAEAKLGGIIRNNNDRLIYMFDLFGGRALYLELLGTYKEDPDGLYPRVVFSQGEPPLQFHSPAGEDSIFAEALGDFGDFEGDELYDDDL